MIDGDGAWRRTKNSMQNEKVAKTNGETKNFEGRMFAKSEILKKTIEICNIFDSHKAACAANHRKRNASATVQNWRNRS